MRLLRRCAGVFACAALVATVAPACSSTAGVGDVWTSPDEDGGRRRNIFYTDSKAIFCLAEVGVGRTDVTLEIIIRYIQEYSITERRVTNTNKVVAYHEERPERTNDRTAIKAIGLVPADPTGKPDDKLPFQAGRGQCEVYLDGKLEGTAIFNIGFPPCPSAAIVPGARCGGFYEEGKDCPMFGETGDPSARCRCDGSAWQC